MATEFSDARFALGNTGHRIVVDAGFRANDAA